jgi:hypothetical protein
MVTKRLVGFVESDSYLDKMAKAGLDSGLGPHYSRPRDPRLGGQVGLRHRSALSGVRYVRPDDIESFDDPWVGWPLL